MNCWGCSPHLAFFLPSCIISPFFSIKINRLIINAFFIRNKHLSPTEKIRKLEKKLIGLTLGFDLSCGTFLITWISTKLSWQVVRNEIIQWITLKFAIISSKYHAEYQWIRIRINHAYLIFYPAWSSLQLNFNGWKSWINILNWIVNTKKTSTGLRFLHACCISKL